MNDEASRIYAMGIRSLANQMQSSFNKSLHCHELLVRMQITSALYRACRCLFMSFKKAFILVLSYNFQVCISDMAMFFNCRGI